MTATDITLAEAVHRLVDATINDTFGDYDDAIADGPPFELPAEGRVFIDHRDGMVSVDLPDGTADGFTNWPLGHADIILDEAAAHGDMLTVAMIRILKREPVPTSILPQAFDAEDDELDALIDQLTTLEDAADPTMIDDQHISLTAALHIYRQLQAARQGTRRS